MQCNKIAAVGLIAIATASPFILVPVCQAQGEDTTIPKYGAAEEDSDAIHGAQDALIDILQRMRTYHESIHSMDVRFTVRTSQESQARTDAYIYRQIAANRSGNLYHFASHGFRGLSWEEDPYRQETFICGELATTHYVASSKFVRFQKAHGTPLPGSLQHETLFATTGVWPFDSSRERPMRKDGSPLMILDVVDSGEYSLTSKVDSTSHSIPCAVIERADRDVIWTDLDSGMIVSREFYSKEGSLMARVKMTELREYPGGIRFPSLVEQWQYDFHSRNLASQRLVLYSRIEIESAVFNNVPENQFVFEPLAGAVRYDGFTDVIGEQVRPGEDEYFDYIATWIRRYHPPRRIQPKGSDVSRLRWFSVAWISLFVATSVFGLLGRLGSHRTR